MTNTYTVPAHGQNPVYPATIHNRRRQRSYFPASDSKLRDGFLARYQPLVRSLAMKFRRGCDSIDDAISVANVGLLKAAARYDPYRGITFGAYAKFIITMELHQIRHQYESMIHLTRDVKVLIASIAQTTESLMHNNGRHPTSREIAASLHISERTVIQAIEAAASRRISSLVHVSSEPANISRRSGCTFQRPNASGAGVTASSDLREALTKGGWVKAKAARLIGMTTRQISYRMQKYQLVEESCRASGH